MKVLIVNPGSTSVKYSLFIENKCLVSCDFDKTENKFTFNDVKIKKFDYINSFSYLTKYLIDNAFVSDIKEIKKIGIRIVHGGNDFIKPTKITKSVFKKLEKISDLAPLHNPPALDIIRQINSVFSKVEIFGVFDTSFHQAIPRYASTYPIPITLSNKFDIKRYGFHGIACSNILRQIKEKTKSLPGKIIICHLGGGCSITAVKNGKSIDTSMGLTPLEGLMMTSRSGDIDPGIIKYMSDKMNLSVNDIFDILNNQSGFYGLTGIKDIKLLIEKALKGDKKCKLALDIFIHRLIKYIYSYFGILKGVDLIVFSGGIGKGSVVLRKMILKELKTIQISQKNIISINVEEALEIYKSIV